MFEKICNIIMIILFMIMGFSITLVVWYRISPETFIEVKHQLLLKISNDDSPSKTNVNRNLTALDVIPLK